MLTEETAKAIREDVAEWMARRKEFRDKVKVLCDEYKDIDPKKALESIVIYWE
ncbi:MAG: hypothetical protein MN733_10510 [Nitrososphaera sp.]|nr:hypothetical protein [Nitrososphaera sp.]